jgi:trans-aconitate methyltransferase
VDVVFSNATLHWILNHKKSFWTLLANLKRRGHLLI